MEVNFKELKRKDLQRLCKKHGVRANTTNAQMADSLVSLFKVCENNKHGTVLSKGFGGNRSSKVEGVEGDAEKVVIVLDADEDKHGSVLRTTDSKSSPKCRIEPRLDGSCGCDDSEATRLKWHEENAIIFLDEEVDEPCPVLRSADKKKYRRINRKAGKACEPSRSNEADQPIGVLRNPKEGILVPVRTTRSRSMNSNVAHSPVVEKMKAREDRQGAPQNVKPPLNTSKVEGSEVVTMKENPSVMMEAGDVRVKRKRKSRNSSMKVNDEIMIHLPNEVSASENLGGGVVNEKQVNNVMGSDITFSIDVKQSIQCTSTQNDQDIEEHELCDAGNLMEVVPESVGTQRRKKRTREGLEEDTLIIEREIDKLGFPHHPDLLHRDEIVDTEVCFGSSQVLGSPSLSNLASSRPCLPFSELQGGQGVEARQECQDFEKVRGGEEVEKRYKLFKDLEGNKEKENGSERQEGYNDIIIWNCDLKKTSPIVLCHEWIIEDISNIASPASETPDEMSNSARLSGNIDRHDDHSVLYLAESNSIKVGREERQVVVQKQFQDMKTLVDRFGESLKEKASIELECIAETPKKSGKLVVTCLGLDLSGKKFQEQAADYGPAFESVVLQELNQIKDGGSFQREGNAHISPEQLKHDGENLRSSEESQAVGYDEDSETKIFAGNPPEQVKETVPFELSKRVDNLMEKLLRLKKVLRGEIAPLITDSSLPCEVDISCEESSATNKEEVTSEKSFPSHEQESQILNALLPTNHVHEDREQDSSNSEVDILNKIDEVVILSSPDALQNNPELWKSTKIYERNGTDAASPFEGHFYVRPAEREPCQDGDIYERQFLDIVQGVTAKSGETLENNEFVSPGKPSSFFLEGERSSSASCISKSKLNNSITNSPTKYISHFESKCLSETVDARSCLASTQAYAKHTVNMLKMESHDEVVNTTLPETLQGNFELWKCMERCEANSTDEASYESDCNYICPAEVDPCQGGDIDVVDLLEITQGATANLREVLEKIKLVSPIKQNHIKLGSERNSCASFSSEKRYLNNNMTNSPAEDIKHFGSHCFSETLGSQSSLPIKQALAKHTVDVLMMEAQEEIAKTSSGDASQGKAELFKCMQSCAAKISDADFPYGCDFSYNFHAVGEPYPGDDIDVRESLNIDHCATTKPGEVLEKMKFLSPSKQSSINLDDERNVCAIGIYKKEKLNNDITNSPAKDIKDCGTQWLSKSSDANHSVDILEVESQEGSVLGADTLVDAVPYEVKVSFGSYTIDPIEEICDRLINFCVSSSQKAAKSNIINTPITNSAGFSSVGFIREKENTQSTKTKYCSMSKIRKSTSAGSIRRPLQSVTNQMIE